MTTHAVFFEPENEKKNTISIYYVVGTCLCTIFVHTKYVQYKYEYISFSSWALSYSSVCFMAVRIPNLYFCLVLAIP